ncbi:hypothetical protein Psfp_03855 [Pelotomaculum sp. FP]|nr:hypothetical protein Psfp_03855 [Pelotomaculum sp. FP]
MNLQQLGVCKAIRNFFAYSKSCLRQISYQNLLPRYLYQRSVRTSVNDRLDSIEFDTPLPRRWS